jgi:hypothetical protein
VTLKVCISYLLGTAPVLLILKNYTNLKASFLRCVSCLQRATPSHRKFFHCRYGGSHKAEHGPHAPEASGALPWPGSQPVTRTVAFVIAAKASSAQWPEHDRLWQSDATSSVAKQLKQRPFNTRGTRRPCLTRWWSFMRGHRCEPLTRPQRSTTLSAPPQAARHRLWRT